MSYPTSIDDLAERAFKTATEKGFWEASQDVPTKLMLIVTEVAEAMDVYRSGMPLTDYGSNSAETHKPYGFVFELADIVIRVLDLAGRFDLPIEQAIYTKMGYNLTREKLHGKIV